MAHHRSSHQSGRTLATLTFLGLYSILMLQRYNVSAETESLSISGRNSFSSSEMSGESIASNEGEGPLLTFLLRPANKGPLDNSAVIHTGDKIISPEKHNKDEGDNNDSNVSSESDSSVKGHRFRREDVKTLAAESGEGKVIAANWGTYEEQTPVVVQSESRTVDANVAPEIDAPSFDNDFQPKEAADSGEYANGQGSISYEEYEDGRFEGRQFDNSRGGDSDEEQQQHDDYYRQKYSATTMRPVYRGQKPERDEDDDEQELEERPQHPNKYQSQRPHSRRPEVEQDEKPSVTSGIMGYIQTAKNFIDIYRAMNTAWKTVEDHYRKNGQGIFPEDLKKMNESTRIAITASQANQLQWNNKKQTNTKKPKTSKTPINSAEGDNEDMQEEKNDEYRSRRSSSDAIANEEEYALTASAGSPSTAQQEIETSASNLERSSSTDVAEGRYIKGDPLKGYYDFIITEGSYKFWAAFQVGTALLIIYSTFAAIYYSKVNPLVSDYDYIDYLGGARSLSDDSDFVDTDVPAGASKTPGASGTSKSRQQQQSSAGWFDWVPHAGHTLRFILDSIDKGYNEEDKK